MRAQPGRAGNRRGRFAQAEEAQQHDGDPGGGVRHRGRIGDHARLAATRQWETRLGLPAGEMDDGCATSGSAALGAITCRRCTAPSGTASAWTSGSSPRSWPTCGASTWAPPNTELIEYARGLRPRYRTGILSNSFVGAREREQAAYGFEDLVDEIVYSHEAGIASPIPGSTPWPARAWASARRDGLPR